MPQQDPLLNSTPNPTALRPVPLFVVKNTDKSDTETDNSDTESEASLLSNTATPETKAICTETIKSRLKLAGLAAIPFISTAADTASIRFSIDDIEGRDLLYSINLEGSRFEAMKNLLPTLYFTSSLSVNAHWVIHGLKLTYRIVFKEILSDDPLDAEAKKIRADWSRLNKKTRALLLAVTLSSAVFDAVCSRYYIDELDDDKNNNSNQAIASIIATIYALTNIFSEGIETIQTIANKEPVPYSSKASRYATNLFNYSATVLGSLTTAIEGFFPVMITFGVESVLAKSLILAWVTTKFTTDYCLNRENCFEVFDDFMKNFFTEEASEDKPKRSSLEWAAKAGIFTASFFSAALLADLQRVFFVELFHSPLEQGTATLPFPLPEEAIQILGIGRGIRDLAINTYYLAPFFEGLLKIAAYLPIKLVNNLSDRCKKDRAQVIEEDETHNPISPRSELSSPATSPRGQFGLFPPSPRGKEKDPTSPEFSKKSSCTIL